MKTIIFWILLTVVIGVLVFLWIRWFEYSNLFFPTASMEETPQAAGLEYEDVYFSSSDGTSLNGWFIPQVDKPRGTILFCHGNAGNISHRLEIITMLYRLGFNVFIFDYRGYGKSKGRPSEKGTYEDGYAAYEYLVSRDDVDKKKILFYGKSLGGAIAVEVASRTDVPAVIIDSTFTSTTDMAKEIYPFLPMSVVITIKYDTLSKMGGLKVPVLVIHSSEDDIVPYHHGKMLFEASIEPKSFLNLRGGHNDSVFLNEDKYAVGINEFLEKIDY
ncbi:MAG: alpha/beta hydrolase [Candidatus Tantalella remota]|nr:alpha/beta hydrolase [Candidatus Tantalella remota]